MDKTCGICQEDCSDRPRVKDAKGRYYCKSCAMDRAASHATEEAHLPPPEDDANPYAIDEGDFGTAAPLPAGMLDLTDRSSPCPACMHSMPPGAKVCVSCGYQVDKGIQTSTKVEKRKGRPGYPCEHCGYDLTGLRSTVCPECGKPNNFSRKHRLNTGLTSQMLRDEYRKPAVWFAVGFVAVGIVLAIKGEPLGFVVYAILLAFQLPLMLIGLWLCQKTFLGDIGTPLLNLVRLAGALALGNAVDTIIPFGFFFLTPGLIVFWAVLMDLFEIDLRDAIITGIIMGIIKIAGALGVVYILIGVLGWSMP